MDNASISAAFTQMQKQIGEMQTAHAAQIVQMQLVAAQARAPKPYTVRIAAPPFYSGSATMQLDDGLAILRSQFAYYSLTEDERQVGLAAAHLKDAALDWYQTATTPVPGSVYIAPT